MLSPLHPDSNLCAEELLLSNDDLNINFQDHPLSSKTDGLTVNFCFHELGCRQDVQRSSPYVKADNVNAGESHGPFVDVSDDYCQQDIFQKIYNDIKSESTTYDQLIGSTKQDENQREKKCATVKAQSETPKQPVNCNSWYKLSEAKSRHSTKLTEHDEPSANIWRVREMCYAKPTSPTPGGPFDGDDHRILFNHSSAHFPIQVQNYGPPIGHCAKRRSPEGNFARNGQIVTKKQATERNSVQCRILSCCKFFSKKNGSACSKEVHRVAHKRGHLTVACSDRHQWVWCPLCCDCLKSGRSDGGNQSGQGCRNAQHWYERDSFDTGVRNHMNSLHKK